MKQSELEKAVALLVAHFPQTKAGDATCRAYEHSLRDLDPHTLAGAVDRLCKTSKFFPTVAEIREVCLELERGPRRPGGEAWGDVLREISRVGSYGVPRFEDHLVARAVAALGWQNLCLSENAIADRARFIELYESYAGTDRTNAQAGPGEAMRLPEPRTGEPERLASAIQHALPAAMTPEEKREVLAILHASEFFRKSPKGGS